jgi:DNA-binding response OmpR family regulator
MAFSVLVVEDEPEWMEALCEMYEGLLDKPDEVLLASTVRTARQNLERKDIDLLSLDINVSRTDKTEGDGRTLIREASRGEKAVGGLVVITQFERDEELDVIMPEKEVPKARMELGMMLDEFFRGRYKYVPKPAEMSPQESVRVIRDRLSQRALLSLCNAENVFRKEGQGWFVRYDGKSTQLKESINFKRIHYLLQRPNEKVSSKELVDAFLKPDPDSLDDRRRDMSREQLEEEEGLSETGGYRGENTLDDKAISEYKERLAEIESQLEIARSTGDDSQIAELINEAEMIRDQLGYSGSGDREKDVLDKHRKTVQKSIKREGIPDISEVHPALAEHLDDAISTGYYCSYEPAEPVEWRL